MESFPATKTRSKESIGSLHRRINTRGVNSNSVLLFEHHSPAVKVVPKIWNNLPISVMKLPQRLNDIEINIGKRD